VENLNLFNLVLVQVQIFLLVFIRIASLFFTAPLFGSKNIPVGTKIGFAFLVSFIIYPIINQNIKLPADTLSYTFIIIKQVLAGAVIGFSAYMVFTAIQFSGQIIDLQMGFGIVNVIDPMSNTQVSIMGQFQFILGMLIFLSINGHHYLFQAVVDSFRLVPIDKVAVTEASIGKISDLFYNMFVIAFRIAGPATLALLLTNVTLGFIARTIPQMNVFIVGLPLNILMGLSAMLLSLPILVNIFNTLLTSMWDDIYFIIRNMRV